jgi:hypothetical protein
MAYFSTTALAIINRPTEPRIAGNQRSIPCTSPAEAPLSAAAKNLKKKRIIHESYSKDKA